MLVTKLKAIADAIRGKTGKTDGLTLDQMPMEIEGIEAGGGGAEAFYTPAGKCYVEHMHITGMVANANIGILSSLYENAVNLKSVVMEGGNISGKGSSSTFSGCTSLVSAVLKNVTAYGHYTFRNCTLLESVQLGSVGFPVTTIGSPYTFMGARQNPVVTIYVDATTIADIPTDVTANAPWGATNATIIYRNSATGEVITE